jgi:hypothetical protein
MTYGHI